MPAGAPSLRKDGGVDVLAVGVKQLRETDRIEPGSLVSPKLDGVFVKATRDGLQTKSGKPITNRPDLRRRLKLHFLLHPKSEIRGELYQHGKGFEDTVSGFRTGARLPLNIHPDTKGPKPLPIFGIRHVRARKVASQAEADTAYQGALKKGYEGQIVQSPGGDIAKRKPWADEEFAVTGKKMGKAHGILTVADKGGKSFRVQVEPGMIGNPDIIGKQATIAFPKKSRKGIPRSPVFKGLRDYENAALVPGMISFS